MPSTITTWSRPRRRLTVFTPPPFRLTLLWTSLLLTVAACTDPDTIDLGPYAANVYAPRADSSGADAGPAVDAGQADTGVGTNPDAASPDAAGPDTISNDATSQPVCPPCDDQNPCTTDACDAATGACTHTPTQAPCSDGNACTTDDTCVGTVCKGTALSCDDNNPCTADGCAPASSKANPTAGCTHASAAGGCDDGDACTTADGCKAGACEGGAAVDCDDKNPCTNDVCDKLKGCKSSPKAGASCDDGDPCTTGDSCTAGACKGVNNGSCGCASDADCAKLASANLCQGTMACDLKTKSCGYKAGSAVVCADGGACAAVACDPKTGGCVKTPAKDGGACDADGDACTVGDACKAGLCVAGKKTDCDDNNPCTDDACNAKQGCLHTANNVSCNDGDPCTSNDYCQKGGCVPGAPKLCGDGKPCTLDSCDAKTGACVHDAKAKDGATCDADASICTLKDVCKAGACTAGKPLVCDDNNPCTSDGCNPLTGCTHAKNAQTCSDGDGCTVGDVCTNGGCKPGGVKTCIDGDKCTLDGCDSKTGSCTFVEIVGCSTKCKKDADCDDSNPCTNDVCDSGSCKNPANTASCDDGSVCTTGDACSGGACVATGKKTCDDGNPCTDDTCHPKAGCQASANSAPCEADGDKCTANDVCKQTVCTVGAKKSCDDGSACSQDSCDPKTGTCSHNATVFAGDACDADGSVCTVGDACAGGVCVKGKALACDDNNACTTDSCDPKQGCVFTPRAGGCEDGDACTLNDQCSKGACAAGAAKSCDDGKTCTTDACDAKTGTCSATPIPGCGNFCKANSDCDDGNGCTVNTCDAKTGACKSQARVGDCKDGDKCWLSGTCKAGSCVGGKKASCDDGNACTTDTCDAASGQCVFTGHNKPCDDGAPCTVGDACAFAKCAAGKAKSCDDSDACTIDACDPKSGACVHTKTSGVTCDDGDACTTGDLCQKGVCKPGTLATALPTVGTGKAGLVDGAASKAQLNQPWSATAGPGGVVYVAELGNHTVRVVKGDGSVATFAGDGKSGLLNGPRLKARFYGPADVQPGLDGELYVADMNNAVVRMIDKTGQVSTFAGKGRSGFKDGYKTVARFGLPVALAVDESGVYMTDLANHAIRLVTIDGQVVTLAGTGKAGFKDGPAAQAQFSSPYGIARGLGGGLYVADSANHRVRFITAAGLVLTVAGATPGFVDGSVQTARFNKPFGLAVASDGTLFVSEVGNRRVRRVGLDGLVYTVFGDGTKAALNDPFAVAIDGQGRGVVPTFGDNVLRRFQLATFACSDGSPCTTDTCDKKTGSCVFAAKASGSSCGKGCYSPQICQSGACVAGQPKDCDDKNSCTGDYCVDGGCKHVLIPKCTP